MKHPFLLVLTCATTLAWGQRPQKAAQQLGAKPVYFIDSVEVSQAALQDYAPESIAALTIYKDAEATRLVGTRGKDGVVYVETKLFDTRHYRRYFARKSTAYAQLVAAGVAETNIQYVLNGRLLTTNYEGDLASIDDQLFQGLAVLDQAALQQRYPDNSATYGVVLTSRTPKNLYHGKRKF